MKGLALARGYYEDIVRPMLEAEFAAALPGIAAGLVGEGSECFGYDDLYSQDHDFGPDCCLWLTDEVAVRYGEALRQAYAALPSTYKGFNREHTSRQAAGRRGVMSVEQFYRNTLNGVAQPSSLMDWFKIPQEALAVATNGEVWEDAAGQFSARRNLLREGYPEEVRRKKLATRLAKMAQSGQYNYPRALRRGDSGSAYLAAAEFINHALGALFLLNERYMPFYKWRFRAAADLPLLQPVVKAVLAMTAGKDMGPEGEAKRLLIEEVCRDIGGTAALRYQVQMADDFLIPLAESLADGVTDASLRQLPLMFDLA